MAPMLPRLLVTLLIGAYSDPNTSPILTPSQVQYLADMRAAAKVASENAEEELLKEFKKISFRTGMMLNGGSRAWKLALMPAKELLAEFKAALNNLEYVSNFGVDPVFRKRHPGEPAMDFATIDKFGYIPNMWELRAAKSPLVNGTSMNQWNVLESAEKGLYQFPLSSKPLPVGPTATEAMERPHYLGGNLRSIDVGLPRYGPYSAVVRNDVVRQRAAILAGDTGGWENGCNSSITPVTPMPPMMKPRFDCDAMLNGKDGRPIPGTADHQLHSVLGNAKFFAKVGGGYERLKGLLHTASYLPRLVHQLLDSEAKATPFETLLYTEAGLLGPLRPQDMKMIVASFSGVYGTPQADILREFCTKHQVPLVWGLNGGETWSSPSKDPARLGPDTESSVDVAADRLLDESSLTLTNVTLNRNALTKAVWDAVHKDITAKRASGEASKLQASDFIDWWKKLKSFGVPIQNLRPGDCASADMCLGTYHPSADTQDCVCKRDGLDEWKVAAFSQEGQSAQPEKVGVVVV